jgi:hypothetical protein
MGIFSHKYLEEGYYQEDEFGNISKVYDNNASMMHWKPTDYFIVMEIH